MQGLTLTPLFILGVHEHASGSDPEPTISHKSHTQVLWDFLLWQDAMVSSDFFLDPCRASCSLCQDLSAWPVLRSAKVVFQQ